MRRAVTLALLLVVAAACSTRSDRVTALPDLPDRLNDDIGNVGIGACSLAAGPSLGALVRLVILGGPAEGAVLPGDAIVGFDGHPIASPSDLVAAVGRSSPGETARVRLIRDAVTELAVEVVLGQSPLDPSRAVMGVEAVTLEQRLSLREVPPGSVGFGGPLTRVVRFDNRFLIFDPEAVTWADLDWVPVSGAAPFAAQGIEIYQFQVLGDGGVVVIGTISGSVATVDVDGWTVYTALTVIDDVLLVGAVRDGGSGIAGETAVLGLDVVTGALRWTAPIDLAGEAVFPSSAARDPFGDRALIRLTPFFDVVPEEHVLLTLSGTEPVIAVARGIPEDGLVVGWHDRNRLMSVPSPQDLTGVSITDVVTGRTTSGVLPSSLSGATFVWPVGDGAGVVVSDGEDLLLATVDDPGVRVLAAGCGEGVLGDPGWGA